MSSAIDSIPDSGASGADGLSPPTDLIECVAALADGRVTSAELVEQALVRIDSTQSTLNAFHDVLIAPTSATPPLPVGRTDGLSSRATQQVIAGACPYAWPWNVLGWPGVSVPAGLTSEGLPFGMQLLGPANSEAMLLSLAAQLERSERWHERVAPHAVHTLAP